MSETPVIPRKIFFGNPDKASVRLSPDGAHIAYLAPVDGVLNVWVATREDIGNARPVTKDTGRGIRMFGWTYDTNRIIYMQDKNGDENWRIYCVNLESDEVSDLTPFEGVQARVMAASPKFPERIIVGLNDREAQWHDVYEVNIITRERKLLYENNRFADFSCDDELALRVAEEPAEDGGLTWYKPGASGEWEKWDSVPSDDALTTGIDGFDKAGARAFIRDSRGRNTAALYSINLDSGEKKLLAEDEKSDAGGTLRHPTEKHVQAVAFTHVRKRWEILDNSIESDIIYLRTVVDGEVEIASRTLDDTFWIVVYLVDDGPVRYYLYDRSAGKAEFLFTNRQELEGLPLAHMQSAVIKSRDGLDLVVYYTLPVESRKESRDASSDSAGESTDGNLGNTVRPEKPLPMVLYPHGGPWARDVWGYDPTHQYLANRGYAVLCVNFRSSTGLGKDFINAGNLQWGEKIHEDQIDAVRWAIDEGIADPGRIAVMGGSFGGYSTLAGLTFSPDVFACGVDIVGPSNLLTLMESIPEYWKPMLEMFATRVGDLRTEEGKALLRKHSPLTYVDRIKKPLLIGQGANDPRVKQAEADQIVEAMKAKNIPVTYALYPDEGHGFARPENRLSFFAVAEAFLAKCLGGRYEEIGTEFDGASIKILEGAEDVPGLSEAMSLKTD